MYSSNRGVTSPVNQGLPANQGEANTVISAMPARMILVEYYDQNGRYTVDTVLEANGEFYAPPNSVAWTRDVKPVTKWLSQGVRKKLPLEKVEISDSVQVLVHEAK